VTVHATVTLRVTGVRSQNPRGFGGAIFTGVRIDTTGTVLDACTYTVVKASRATLWWSNFLGQVDRRTIRNRRGKKIDDKKAPTI